MWVLVLDTQLEAQLREYEDKMNFAEHLLKQKAEENQALLDSYRNLSTEATSMVCCLLLDFAWVLPCSGHLACPGTLIVPDTLIILCMGYCEMGDTCGRTKCSVSALSTLQGLLSSWCACSR